MAKKATTSKPAAAQKSAKGAKQQTTPRKGTTREKPRGKPGGDAVQQIFESFPKPTRKLLKLGETYRQRLADMKGAKKLADKARDAIADAMLEAELPRMKVADGVLEVTRSETVSVKFTQTKESKPKATDK